MPRDRCLLGLLEPRFTALAEAPEGDERRRLRDALARPFVHRRRRRRLTA